MGFSLSPVLELPFICNLVWSWPASFWCRLFFVYYFGKYLVKLMMKTMVFISLLSATLPALADSCLDSEELIKLDQRYESAMQQGDVEFLRGLLAEEFYWVHNLASLKENKAQLLERIQKPEEQPRSRRSHDLSVRQLKNTAVVEGLSSVEKWNADGKTFRTSRYQVMRTYVAMEGECKLLAVQSMKVWSSDGQ